MSNKIKNLIKDFPTIGEKVLNLYYENKEMGEFAVSVNGCEDLIICITNIPKATHNAKDWQALKDLNLPSEVEEQFVHCVYHTEHNIAYDLSKSLNCLPYISTT